MIKKSPKAQYTYILIFYYCHVFFRVVNKKKTFDPVDYESIDKTEFWIAEEVESPPLVTLSAEEIQDDIIY